MRRSIVLLVVLSMMLTMVLAGCGGKSDAKVLRVAMECVYPPYNWTQTNSDNGAVKIAGTSDYAYGYDVMWAKRIAEELGYELEIVKSDWDSLVPAIMTGDVDLVIAGQSVTAERLEKVDFTTPYYYASIVVLTTKDSPYASATSVADLEGATVTSQLGTIWFNTCLPQIPYANILPAQNDVPAMLTAVDSGAVDLVVTDQPTALAACEAYPNMVMLDFTGTDGEFDVDEEEINIGISVQKGNTELLNAVNSVLAKYTPDDFANMMNEAIKLQPMNND